MTDIVERLRASVTKGHEPTDEDAIEAADEIERLRAALAEEIAVARETDDALAKADAEIERLREVVVRMGCRLPSKAADEIERLRGIEDAAKKAADIYEAEIERLRTEAEEWRNRYEAERDDHEATIEHANKHSGGDVPPR
jgi:chromosome segregation ATPase